MWRRGGKKEGGGKEGGGREGGSYFFQVLFDLKLMSRGRHSQSSSGPGPATVIREIYRHGGDGGVGGARGERRGD